MEIICIDKRTFDELVVRTEKMDGQSGGMRDSPHIKENASGIS